MTNKDKDRLLRRMEIEISDTFIWDFVFKARDGKTDIDEASNGIFDYVMECIKTVLNEEAGETTNVEIEEAIKILRETAWLEGGNGEKTYKALNMGIDALEKKIPKKPVRKHLNYYCPECDIWLLWDDAEPNDNDMFCPHCGTPIDWSEE